MTFSAALCRNESKPNPKGNRISAMPLARKKCAVELAIKIIIEREAARSKIHRSVAIPKNTIYLVPNVSHGPRTGSKVDAEKSIESKTSATAKYAILKRIVVFSNLFAPRSKLIVIVCFFINVIPIA